MTEMRSTFLRRILDALVTRPEGSSVNRESMRSFEIVALGSVQTIVGLLNMALSPDRPGTYLGRWTGLGTWYIEFGLLVSIFASCCPSRCSVSFAVLMNIIGSIYSAIRFVLHNMDLANAQKGCGWNSSNRDCRYVAITSHTLNILAALQLGVCLTLTCLGTQTLLNWKKGGTDVEENHCVEKEVLLPRITV